MHQKRTMTREIGTAFAVLAIYLLTVLAPLHHARASQLQLAELGYETIATGWVLCAPLGSPGNDKDTLVAKCPATGIGKHDLAAPMPPVVAVAFVATSKSVSVAFAARPRVGHIRRHSAPPRAPPVSV